MEIPSVILERKFSSCNLCPHTCNVNRLISSSGICQLGSTLHVAYTGLHFGEEPMLSGTRGSGTIFFMHCNLKCVYCQNWQISQSNNDSLCSREISVRELSDIMLGLQGQGGHNINLVSPTPYQPLIREALVYARKNGLIIPIVYNTNGYEKVETLQELEGIVDIYLPDMKYGHNLFANRYSQAPRYCEISQAAIVEMVRQVGLLVIDDQGIAQRGMIVRHLVLPEGLSSSYLVLDFLASLSLDITISLMSQYSPQYRAHEFSVLDRHLMINEYNDVLDYAESLGLQNVLMQELASQEEFLPDFKNELPFS